ncbi:MAG: alpha/beta hydrolase family protein [Armatimonadota bacterium]
MSTMPSKSPTGDPTPQAGQGLRTPPSITGEPTLYSDVQLHGVCYTPAGAVTARVLLLTPLFEEKRCAHRAIVTCARALAQAGAAVFIPDLYATGNSRGALTDISLDRWHDDVQAAFDFLTDRADGPSYLVGCRAGALLAAHAVAAGLTVERFILWQPVTAGRGYLHQTHTRRMIQDSMTGETPPEIGQYEIEGQELSRDLYTQLEALNLPAECPPCDVRLLQCSFNEKLLAEYQKLVSRWGEERVRAHSVVAEPFWHPHSPSDYADLAAALTREVLA